MTSPSKEPKESTDKRPTATGAAEDNDKAAAAKAAAAAASQSPTKPTAAEDEAETTTVVATSPNRKRVKSAASSSSSTNKNADGTGSNNWLVQVGVLGAIVIALLSIASNRYYQQQQKQQQLREDTGGPPTTSRVDVDVIPADTPTAGIDVRRKELAFGEGGDDVGALDEDEEENYALKILNGEGVELEEEVIDSSDVEDGGDAAYTMTMEGETTTVAAEEDATANINLDTTSTTMLTDRPNLLFLTMDQLRWDCIGAVQNMLPEYSGKLKIRTPNIERLMRSGVYFSNAYCVSPSCAPSRASFRTGTTVQRHAITGNKVVKQSIYKKMPIWAQRVNALVSYEQVLADQKGYAVETYGKWHTPTRFFFSKKNPGQRIVNYTYFDFATNEPKFMPAQAIKQIYQKQLNVLLAQDSVQVEYGMGQQRNIMSGLPYSPAMMDPRYGRATNTPLTKEEGFSKAVMGASDVIGRDALSAPYTTTAVLAKMSLRALDRLIRESNEKPFSLSVHFNAPHPPIVATSSYLNYYDSLKDTIAVPPSLKHDLWNTPYVNANSRLTLLNSGLLWNDEKYVQDTHAIYYAMIEEVDQWLGLFLNRLEKSGLDQNTLVIFTSDHGDMLGAHGLKGKGVLFEESSKVPLMISFPGKIPGGKVVDTPVSHIDLFATIMDYLNAKEFDQSDGKTLRRYMGDFAYNQFFDDEYAVVEIDGRRPLDSTTLTGRLGATPNLSIRHGRWKLILPKNRNSPQIMDMLYDLKSDPFEQNNRVGLKGKKAPGWIIGKAEHLKILLIEWMTRVNTGQRFYSDPKWNNGEGAGNIAEIKARRQWKKMQYWQSDLQVTIGKPTRGTDGVYRRNEYFYIGRTVEDGQLVVPSITIEGPNKGFFAVAPKKATISGGGGYARIKIYYRSKKRASAVGLQANLVITNSVNGKKVIPIRGVP